MSDRLTLFFEPLDVLQFRDYRPFDAGYNVLGQSVFPLPGVFLGCVRAALFRDARADFRKKPDFGIDDPEIKALLGGSERVGTLQLRGPLVARRDKDGTLHPYFPMPSDLVEIKDEKPGNDPRAKRREPSRYTVLAPRSVEQPDGPRFYHGRPGQEGGAEPCMEPIASVLPWTHHELGKAKDGSSFLTLEGAREYARGRAEPFALEPEQAVKQDKALAVKQDKILIIEDRYGISRSPDSLTVEPQRFYLQRPYRLARDHGFAVEVRLPDGDQAKEAIRKLDDRTVQLGGRGHRARVKVHDQALVPEELTASTGPARKLWFLTPAPLRPGLPSWPAGMAVVTERVQAIGGFDQANRRPRPLFRALPAGTVVHVQGKSIHDVETALCGFSRDRSPDIESELDRELERLQHAGFAMALPVGAGEGEP